MRSIVQEKKWGANSCGIAAPGEERLGLTGRNGKSGAGISRKIHKVNDSKGGNNVMKEDSRGKRNEGMVGIGCTS